MPDGWFLWDVSQESMQIQAKGYGWLVPIVVIASFLVVRPLVEVIYGRDFPEARSLINGIVLSVSGIVLFGCAAYLDRRSGINVFRRPAWTSKAFESQHTLFGMPLRLVAIILVVLSLIF